MALPTRTVYVILVITTSLLYFLYAVYTSSFEGQINHFSSWRRGNMTYSLASSNSQSTDGHNITNANVTALSSSNNNSDNNVNSNKNNSSNSKTVNVRSSIPAPVVAAPVKINKTSSSLEVKQSVIQRIPPKSENGTLDYIVQGVTTKKVYDSGFSIPNVELCPDLGRELQLLIVISTAPKHSESRMAIRQTWGHYHQRNDIAVGFIVGISLDNIQPRLVEESNLYGDLIQGNFIDTYNNLTLKTVSMLEWVDNYCGKAKFILKTDDDMFINVPKLLNFLSKHGKDKRKIFGRLAKKWKPIRNKSSKYYVAIPQYRHPLFPDFTTGPAYVMTKDVIHDLYTTALEKTYLKLEDVYTTGIVAQERKIQRVHINEFFNRRVTLNPCNVQKGISIHMVKTFEQYDLWKKLLDGRSKC